MVVVEGDFTDMSYFFSLFYRCIFTPSSVLLTCTCLLQVTAFDEKHYDDAFTIQHVDSRLVDIFHYMAGMVPFLQKLVRDVSRKPTTTLSAADISFTTFH